MTTKRYPFSVRKNGHNLEFVNDYFTALVLDMESGDKPWNQVAYNKAMEFKTIYASAISATAGVYWATGREYDILTQSTAWAVCRRDVLNRR